MLRRRPSKTASVRLPDLDGQPAAAWARVRIRRRLIGAMWLSAGLARVSPVSSNDTPASAPQPGNGPPVALPAAPAPPRSTGLLSAEASRSDEGLLLSFVVGLELTRSVEDALLKGVPLVFTAQAQFMRERWYWTDRRVNTATRSWRLAYQPLTRRFRVSQGGLAQSFDDLGDALAAVGRATAWRIVDPSQVEEGKGQYVDFSYRLDTSQLPRPMQIGIGGQADWSLVFERRLRVD